MLPLIAAESRCECYTVAYKIRGQLVEAQAAETAHALIPATKSEDRGVRSAALRALLQVSSQLRSLREHTEREVNGYLHPPAVNP